MNAPPFPVLLTILTLLPLWNPGSPTNGGIAERGNNAVADDLKPRWTNKVMGEKLSVRGLFGLGDDVEVSKPAFEANAKACSSGLNKLPKLRRKQAARAERKVRRKRADINDPEDDEDDVEDDETDVGDDMDIDDDSEDGMDLGPDSHTVPIGGHELFPFENDEDSTILGTVEMNSCSGILIVGKKGAVIAHLEPISPNEGRSEDTFKQDVANKVSKHYTDNKANLADARMYIAVPNGDSGEKRILGKAADNLGITKDTTGYNRVADEIWDTKDYMKSGKGVMQVNFKDQNSPKVQVFGNNK